MLCPKLAKFFNHAVRSRGDGYASTGHRPASASMGPVARPCRRWRSEVISVRHLLPTHGDGCRQLKADCFCDYVHQNEDPLLSTSGPRWLRGCIARGPEMRGQRRAHCVNHIELADDLRRPRGAGCRRVRRRGRRKLAGNRPQRCRAARHPGRRPDQNRRPAPQARRLESRAAPTPAPAKAKPGKPGAPALASPAPGDSPISAAWRPAAAPPDRPDRRPLVHHRRPSLPIQQRARGRARPARRQKARERRRDPHPCSPPKLRRVPITAAYDVPGVPDPADRSICALLFGVGKPGRESFAYSGYSDYHHSSPNTGSSFWQIDPALVGHLLPLMQATGALASGVPGLRPACPRSGLPIVRGAGHPDPP